MAEEAARQLNQFRKTPEEQLEKYLKHNKPVFRKGDKPMTFFKSFKVSFNKVKDLIKDSNLHQYTLFGTAVEDVVLSINLEREKSTLMKIEDFKNAQKILLGILDPTTNHGSFTTGFYKQSPKYDLKQNLSEYNLNYKEYDEMLHG